MSELSALEDYFNNTVKPTVEEFNLDKSNLRRARVAAIVVFHICDYAKKLRFKPYIEVMEGKEGALGKILGGRIGFMHELIRLSANATKHYQLDNKKGYIQKAEQIKNNDSPGLFCAPFGDGVFDEANHVFIEIQSNPNIEIKDLNNKTISISIALNEVTKWWEDAIYHTASEYEPHEDSATSKREPK